MSFTQKKKNECTATTNILLNHEGHEIDKDGSTRIIVTNDELINPIGQ